MGLANLLWFFYREHVFLWGWKALIRLFSMKVEILGLCSTYVVANAMIQCDMAIPKVSKYLLRRYFEVFLGG